MAVRQRLVLKSYCNGWKKIDGPYETAFQLEAFLGAAPPVTECELRGTADDWRVNNFSKIIGRFVRLQRVVVRVALYGELLLEFVRALPRSVAVLVMQPHFAADIPPVLSALSQCRPLNFELVQPCVGQDISAGKLREYVRWHPCNIRSLALCSRDLEHREVVVPGPEALLHALRACVLAARRRGQRLPPELWELILTEFAV